MSSAGTSEGEATTENADGISLPSCSRKFAPVPSPSSRSRQSVFSPSSSLLSSEATLDARSSSVDASTSPSFSFPGCEYSSGVLSSLSTACPSNVIPNSPRSSGRVRILLPSQTPTVASSSSTRPILLAPRPPPAFMPTISLRTNNDLFLPLSSLLRSPGNDQRDRRDSGSALAHLLRPVTSSLESFCVELHNVVLFYAVEELRQFLGKVQVKCR
eukprot:GHVT01006023.1.p1 GENE.GHVT01006023.1~~GHVT01006023.1.p1  ORF type:complete len:215 (-),score=13.29 GHVT01006023.1:19-663(-)